MKHMHSQGFVVTRPSEQNRGCIPDQEESSCSEGRVTTSHFPRMCTMRWLLIVAAAALIGCSTTKDAEMSKFNQKPVSFKKKVTRPAHLDYLLFLPSGYKKGSAQKWPLMLFLHGA